MSLIFGLTKTFLPITRLTPFARGNQFFRLFSQYKSQSRQPQRKPKQLSVSSSDQQKPYLSQTQGNHHFGSLIQAGKFEEAMKRMDEYVAAGYSLSVITVSKLIQDISTDPTILVHSNN
jgi:hypothetical protein